MNDKVNILIYEDNEADVPLIKRELGKLDIPLTFFWAVDEISFKSALEENAIDIVLSDYAIIGFNGMNALLYTTEYFPDIIFIFVTGTVNDEELAAQTILNGASHYVLKTRLQKLPEIVAECLKNKSNRKSQAEIDHKIESISHRIAEQISANSQAIDKADDYLKKIILTDDMVAYLHEQLKESNEKLRRFQEELKQ